VIQSTQRRIQGIACILCGLLRCVGLRFALRLVNCSRDPLLRVVCGVDIELRGGVVDVFAGFSVERADGVEIRPDMGWFRLYSSQLNGIPIIGHCRKRSFFFL
jgi:hypothetical protein